MLPLFEHAMHGRGARIAGWRIGPLTLAQAYCLHAWESPLVCGGDVDLTAFAVALWTCRQRCWPFDRFTADVNRGRPDRQLARLGRRYDMRRFGDDVAALRAHIAWHCQIPPRFVKGDSKAGGLCAPWPMVVAVQVMPLLGERRTWRAPVPYVMAHKIAMDNAQGDTSWKSEAEHAMGYANGRNSQSDK
jgi:hypothetical protein